ncbi:hypothetical protein [Colwellia sp. MEBiC06753]
MMLLQNLSTYIHEGVALIAGNGYSLIKISNAGYKPFKLALRQLFRKVITLQIVLMENDYTGNNLLCSNFPDVALNWLNI